MTRRLAVLSIVALVLAQGVADDLMARPVAAEVGPSAPASIGSDPDGHAEVWFGPNDHLLRPWKPEHRGPADFMELFRPGAPWAHGRSKVKYFQTWSWTLERLSDAELTTIIDFLRSTGIKLAVEDGVLPYASGCGAPIEGEADPTTVSNIFRRFKALGGTIDAFVADAPYYAGSQHPTGCRATPQAVAVRFATFETQIREVFPAIEFGTVEPYHFGFAGTAGYVAFLDAYRELTGRYPAFLHCDMPSSTAPGWYPRLMTVRGIARERKIAFGIIYNGNSGDGYLVENSDAEWLQNARDKAYAFELSSGGPPDHAILESWVRYPTSVLPEDDERTHTSLIRWYTRPRTFSETRYVDGVVSGRVFDVRGKGVSGVPITVRMIPVSGKGVVNDYVITGSVPANASKALVIVRGNSECEPEWEPCEAPLSLNLYAASYREGSGENRIPDPTFADGGRLWGLPVGDVARVVASDRDSGSMLRVMGSAHEAVIVNSTEFSVAPNSPFEARFTSRVAPGSFDAGYFGIVFLSGGTESTRVRVPWRVEPLVGAASTDDSGHFALPARCPEDTACLWNSVYEGDASYWPSTEKRIRRRGARR